MQYDSEDDGEKAVELFKFKNKSKSELNIDLIIIDLNMKSMDGDEASKKVFIIFFYITILYFIFNLFM
jgi:CheY-like chemotaxis protein